MVNEVSYINEGKILKYFILIVAIIIVINLILFFSGVIEAPFSKFKNSENDRGEEERVVVGEDVVVMSVPAVDAKGNGIPTTLMVELKEGDGKTLVSIESLLFWADTQQSIRMARTVAENITGIGLGDNDLIYSVDAGASLIGGPSAGAALTIATIAVLEGKELNDDVMITGSVNHDGTIGPVSEILPKAKACKEAGATLFLVPMLQSREVIYEAEEHCETFGEEEFCIDETIPLKINITEESGIELREVLNIQEAMQYFFD